MLFVTVGIVILVASFVLALISLVREQKSISSKPHEPNIQPETSETNTEEPVSTTNQVLEPASNDQPVSQAPEETTASKSDVILRLEEQIEKAKTTEQAPSARPEAKQNTDEFWNKMMKDEEEHEAPSEPFPWEQPADAGPVQTQETQAGGQTEPAQDQTTEQSSGGVIRMSDLIKKP